MRHRKQHSEKTYEECPICKAKTWDYCSFPEYGLGTVEQHGFCQHCGFCVEQAYSPTMVGFIDIKRGYKQRNGDYIEKNERKHKRIRKNRNMTGYQINEQWMYMC